MNKLNASDYQVILIKNKSLGGRVAHLSMRGKGQTLCGSSTRFKGKRRFVWIGAIGCKPCRDMYGATSKSFADYATEAGWD